MGRDRKLLVLLPRKYFFPFCSLQNFRHPASVIYQLSPLEQPIQSFLFTREQLVSSRWEQAKTEKEENREGAKPCICRLLSSSPVSWEWKTMELGMWQAFFHKEHVSPRESESSSNAHSLSLLQRRWKHWDKFILQKPFFCMFNAKPGLMVHVCNPSAGETEVGRLQTQDQSVQKNRDWQNNSYA